MWDVITNLTKGQLFWKLNPCHVSIIAAQLTLKNETSLVLKVFRAKPILFDTCLPYSHSVIILQLDICVDFTLVISYVNWTDVEMYYTTNNIHHCR